jgi:hypothetical protein
MTLKKNKKPARATRKPSDPKINGKSRDIEATLRRDYDQLRRRVAELRRENKALKTSLGALLAKPVTLSKRELLKQAVFQPTIVELLDELATSKG